MSTNIGTTTITTGASELMSNVRGAVQLTFDVFDLLLDARQSAAMVSVKSAQQIVGQATFFKAGFDFVNMVMDRGYAFERDVLIRVRKTVDPKDVSFVGSGLIQPLGSTTAAGVSEETSLPPTIHVTARQGTSQVSVLLQLQNHLASPEKIILSASPFSVPGGTQQIAGRISFDPFSLEIPAKSTGTAKIVISVTPEFLVGFDYHAEIDVQGTHGKRIPLVMTILPAESPAPLAKDAAAKPGAGDIHPSGG